MFFDDYEISDCYDESFEEIGMSREDVTAEFLASVEHINEFYVNFEDINGNECGCGEYDENRNDKEYRIKILEMGFVDMKTEEAYKVNQEVLEAYNKGE